MSSIELAKKIRVNSLKLVHRAKASHIGSALSIADILAVLYSRVLTFNQKNSKMKLRDRFVLSKGHACVAVYAVLSELGFFDKEELSKYGQNGSIFMNHISHFVPGVEFSTGSLGHGLPFCVGKSMAAKHKKKGWDSYVLLSDGEMAEGSNWEAMLFAAHHKLDNLTVIIDNNNLQSITTVEETISLSPLFKKLVAFNFDVIEIDGHNHDEIYLSLTKAKVRKPRAIIARTIKGKGVSFMENTVKWHYACPNDEELKEALKQLE